MTPGSPVCGLDVAIRAANGCRPASQEESKTLPSRQSTPTYSAMIVCPASTLAPVPCCSSCSTSSVGGSTPGGIVTFGSLPAVTVGSFGSTVSVHRLAVGRGPRRHRVEDVDDEHQAVAGQDAHALIALIAEAVRRRGDQQHPGADLHPGQRLLPGRHHRVQRPDQQLAGLERVDERRQRDAALVPDLALDVGDDHVVLADRAALALVQHLDLGGLRRQRAGDDRRLGARLVLRHGRERERRALGVDLRLSSSSPPPPQPALRQQGRSTALRSRAGMRTLRA